VGFLKVANPLNSPWATRGPARSIRRDVPFTRGTPLYRPDQRHVLGL